MTVPFALPLRLLVVALLLGAAATPSLRSQNDPASRREAIEAIYPVMIGALEAKNFGRARNICEQAILWEPQNPVHHYNLACIEAQAGGARLSHAIGALELAIALGFDDAAHLQADPDLEPLHGDPRFRELVRKVIYQAAAGDAQSAIVIPPARPQAPPPEPAPAATELPAEAGIRDGVPVGLYFMTRFQPATRTLEKAAWYFAPDGAVYQNLESGFSAAALAAHSGPKGRVTTRERRLEVTWTDGTRASSDLERDGTGFIWDMGIFTAVKPFADASEVTGNYEAGDAGQDGAPASRTNQRLELRADGTFAWGDTSGSSGGGTASAPAVSRGGGPSEGRWELDGYLLTLTDNAGAVTRRVAFPCEGEVAPGAAGWMFFGGRVYKRQR